MEVKIIVDSLRYEEKLIVNEFKKHNIPYRIVLTSTLSLDFIDLNDISNLILMRSPSYFKNKLIAEYYQLSNCFVFNSFSIIDLFGNKLKTDIWLKQNNIRLIPTRNCFAIENALVEARKIGYPIVAKPLIGGFGELVHLVQSEREFKQLLEIYKKFAPATHKMIYYQKKIDIKKDIRVITLGTDIIASVIRTNIIFKKNIAAGGISTNYSLNETENKFIKEIINLIWTDAFLGIDLLVDKNNNYYICDINPVCLFKDAIKASGINIAEILVKFLITKVGI